MRHASCLLLAALALLLPACGPGTGTISGVVKYKGQPVAGASITFFDEQHVTPSAVIAKDGSYQLTAPVGTAKVAVITPPAGEIPGLPVQTIVPIPEKYRDPETSGLVYNVKGGAQIHNLDLTD